MVLIKVILYFYSVFSFKMQKLNSGAFIHTEDKYFKKKEGYCASHLSGKNSNILKTYNQLRATH